MPKLLAYVVDDEEVIAETVALILDASGFEAQSFTKPLEALRAAGDESRWQNQGIPQEVVKFKTFSLPIIGIYR